MTTFDADLVVVGLGAMGAATTYHAAKAGLRVIGIDQFAPPHNLGSTHGETRITRLAVGEGPQYLPFVARAHEIWRDLEAATGETLFHQSGGLLVTEQHAVPGQRWEDFAHVTKAIADDAGIDFSIETPADVRQRYPMYQIPDDYRVGFEPTAGLVMAERAVAAQLVEAQRHGAQVRTGQRVTDVRHDATGVDVRTTTGSVRASHVVLATGPWIHDLAPRSLAETITITRQIILFFEVEDLSRYTTDRLPWMMWIAPQDEDYVGVFPAPPGGSRALKFVGEQFVETTTPDTVLRTVSVDEISDYYEQLLVPKVSGVTPNCIKAEVCLYANTVDDHFLIDHHPDTDRIMVMSPCSGHGFKHSTALGEAVAQQLVSGDSDLDLSPFATK